MSIINTCITDIPLGKIINPHLNKSEEINFHEAIKEYPISSLMTGNVRSYEYTPMDVIENYLIEQQKQLIKYAQKANTNKLNTERHFSRLNNAILAHENLKKSKVEVWLYIYDCIRAIEQKDGLFGDIRINLPLRHDIIKTGCLDFINQKAIIWTL